MNEVTIMGRMARDAEIRNVGEHKVASFAVAVDAIKKGETYFLDCEAWNGTADMVSKYFPKGRMIALTGRIVVSKYESNGQKRTAWRINADRVFFCGDKASAAPSSAPAQDDGGWAEFNDDDAPLPF